jgi:hypothetical protein
MGMRNERLLTQRPSDTQAFVYLERVIQLWVVDEALPSDGRPGFLEVDTHHDEKIIFGLIGISFQLLRVSHCRIDIVN